MKKLVRLFTKRLLTALLGRSASHSLHLLVRSSAIHNQRPAVCRPENASIMVLAPHMDDEVLGCGGTVARHAAAGADVCVVFLTDGRYGGGDNAAMSEAERTLRERELIELRRAEARRAAAVLGVRRIEFFEAEDGRLHIDTRVPRLLRAILQRQRPQVVYLPSFLENHTDHAAAGEMLLTAAAADAPDFECRCYEVWTPLFPNIIVEIDGVVELKKQALECYGSQLERMDYVHTSIGLNAYRSSAIGCRTARFVEAFYALPFADYRRLVLSVAPVL